MTEEYLEVILVWKESGPSSEVTQWLTERGLQTIPMKQGLLLTGSLAQFESAFGTQIDLNKTPRTLPIPEALREAVSSINLPKRPDYQ